MYYNEFVRPGRDARARWGQEDATGLCFVSPPYYILLYTFICTLIFLPQRDGKNPKQNPQKHII